jgi:putative hydrolase of the HAD superfamily
MKHEEATVKGHIHPMTPISTGEVPRGLSKIRRVKALLFDVYGTLLISSSGDRVSPGISNDQKRMLAGVLHGFCIDQTPESLMDALSREIEKDHQHLRQEGIAYPEVDIIQIWQRVLGVDDPECLEAFAMAYEMAVNPVYPMPGIEDLLSACREQNLLLGIISNAQFYTARLIEQLLGTSLDMCGFDPQLTFYSYRFRSAKPSNFMFQLAADVFSRREILPASVLYVGNDMRNDILPAKTIGFQTALFAGDQRSLRRRSDDARCRHLVPDMIVTDLRQLIVGIDSP